MSVARRRRRGCATARARRWRGLALAALAALATSISLPGCASPVPPLGLIGQPRTPLAAQAPDTVRPLAYHLKLAVDPAAATFAGEVELELELTAPTSQLWLHAVALEIDHVELERAGRRFAPRKLEPQATRLGLTLDRELPAGRLRVKVRYRGSTAGDEQGLFRRVIGERSYLFSQAEAQHARRITPCIDEPRFKVPWSVQVTAPRDTVVLGNREALADRPLPDGRHQVTFATTPPMPSYLLAVAVGPFQLVELGRLGRGQLPVRLAVAPEHAGATQAAAALLPKVLDGLETLLAQPLPLAKLDLVEVPDFFGAMEHPGLITIDAATLLIDQRPGTTADAPTANPRANLARVLIHELAHQWFGNLVTPASWEDLWLSEALATWATHQAFAELPELDHVLARLTSRCNAWAADLRHPAAVRRAGVKDVERLFDAISYDKGSALLTMMAHWLGEARFAAALRAFVAESRERTVDAAALAVALGRLDARAGRVLLRALDHRGIPTVTLELRCDDTPSLRLQLSADDGPLPVCVRFDAGERGEVRCDVVERAATWTLPAGRCPRWLVGNDDLRGYYRTRWSASGTSLPPPPLTARTRGERLGQGWELALELGEDPARLDEAVAELRARVDAPASAPASPEQDLADLELIHAVERWLGDDELPAWQALVAGRAAAMFARLGDPVRGPELERARAQRMLEVLRDVPWPAAVARAAMHDARRAGQVSEEAALTWTTAVRGGQPEIIEELLGLVGRGLPAARNAAPQQALAALPASAAPQLWAALDRGALSWSAALPALRGWLGRRQAQGPVLAELVRRRAELARQLAPVEAQGLLEAAAGLCRSGQAAQLEQLLAAFTAPLPQPQVKTSTLAAIHRCAQRAERRAPTRRR